MCMWWVRYERELTRASPYLVGAVVPSRAPLLAWLVLAKRALRRRRAKGAKAEAEPPAPAEGGAIVVRGGTATAGAKGGALAVPLRRRAAAVPVPQWHAPWALHAVASGHLGWVRCVAFDPQNQWFVTGSADRTIKVWDLAKCSAGAQGGLKLTLTGHVGAVRGLAVSPRSAYAFSAGDDKKGVVLGLGNE